MDGLDLMATPNTAEVEEAGRIIVLKDEAGKDYEYNGQKITALVVGGLSKTYLDKLTAIQHRNALIEDETKEEARLRNIEDQFELHAACVKTWGLVHDGAEADRVMIFKHKALIYYQVLQTVQDHKGFFTEKSAA